MSTCVDRYVDEFPEVRSPSEVPVEQLHRAEPAGATPPAHVASALVVGGALTLAVSAAVSLALWPDPVLLGPALSFAHGVVGGSLTFAVVVSLIAILFIA